MPELVIAIDGPAGAGKSTVAKLVAARLGLSILDTGAMYRCAALACLRAGVSIEDAEAAAAAAESVEIEFLPGSPQRVLLNGEDVTHEIRSLEVSQAASKVSVHPRVRRTMVARQQQMASAGGCVLEGRDVTTVVAPHAEVKVFLTASIEERARRRWQEAKSEGSLAQFVHEVVERDHRDYTRPDSPLTLAEDAVIIESFGRTPEEIAEQIAALASR